MNKNKIKEFAEIASNETDKNLQCEGEFHPDYHTVWNETFAELIIQECLNAIVATKFRPANEEDYCMHAIGMITAINGIKQRFGLGLDREQP